MKQNPGSVTSSGSSQRSEEAGDLGWRGGGVGESGRNVSHEMYNVARQICFIWAEGRCVCTEPFWL